MKILFPHTFSIVWLSFLPIYFGTNNDYKVCEEKEWTYSYRTTTFGESKKRVVDGRPISPIVDRISK